MWTKEVPTVSGLYYRTPTHPTDATYTLREKNAVELVHVTFNEIRHTITCTVLYSSASHSPFEAKLTNKYSISEKYHIEGKYFWNNFTFPSPPSDDYFPRDYVDDLEEVKSYVG